ncbi:aminotransferase class I/II-fold pyridoxal phosphate-dependent enzyme [Saccharothrix algeriensis]|uniref:histidinol-phosphate transaminase n=2 Tax=Saccharothrix algeriensis TaxID=173560 RepID=A0ABS2S3Z1_9PSEU|nr:pyridoxal phosphate-dependent aminotransferase [Saccharothrix algeriensis]MBM7809801.1 histidinol-phosphate/aromatic aminotransferase/cobyric acid decarboxylase-like protein [Saccharothrix algeriensis]
MGQLPGERPIGACAGAPDPLREAVLRDLREARWHQQPRLGGELRARIGAHYGVAPENVLVARGCTEAVAWAFSWAVRTAPRHRRAVLAIPRPSWPGFTRLADHAGIAWSHYDAGDPPAPDRIPVVCSPNNPTGHVVDETRLARWCSSATVPVVVDCTYDDFADDPVLPRAHRYLGGPVAFCANLTKSTGLVGVRLGLLIAAADVVAGIEAGVDPFRLDLFQLAVLNALFTTSGRAAWRDLVVRTRDAGARCAALLAELLPCGAIGPTVGNVVYGRSDGCCDEHRALLAAMADVTVFPVERRFRLHVDDGTAEALTALARDGKGCR